MKKQIKSCFSRLAGITLAGILFCSLTSSSQAQTNTSTAIANLIPVTSFSHGLAEMANSLGNSTNWDIVGGYGRSTAGANNVAFAALNVRLSEYVGAILGYDYLWNDTKSQFNSIKGGASLSTDIRPFLFLGYDKLNDFHIQPFVADLIATPRSGNAIGNIVTAGFNCEFYTFGKLKIEGGYQYEKRIGQGEFDGNYNLFHVGIGRRF